MSNNLCLVCGEPAITEWREYDLPTKWTCSKHYPESRSMTITVLAPAYYNSLYPVRYLEASAKKNGIDIHWYGRNKPYPGWYNVQIKDLLAELACVTTSHVLYTDASDAIFLSDLEEIKEKYEILDSPAILISRERSGVCAGGILAATETLIYELIELQLYRVDDPDPDNPQVRWRAAIADGYIQAKIDEDSEIFQVVDEELYIPGNRVYNPRTHTFPSIIHFAGGYSSPTDGKAALIEPFWKGLGYAL